MAELKPTSRLQRALQALNKLTDLQIEQLNQQESLSDLRMRRLQNIRSKVRANSSENNKFQFQSQTGIQSEQPHTTQSSAKWNLLAQMPIIDYRNNQRNFQKDFIARMEEFRENVRKQQMKKQQQSKMQEEKPKPVPEAKQGGIFSAVFNSQIGPSLGPTNNNQFMPKVSQNPLNSTNLVNKPLFQGVKNNNSIFAGSGQSLFKNNNNQSETNRPLFSNPLNQKLSQTKQSSQHHEQKSNVQQNKDKQNNQPTGFIPGQFHSSVQSSLFQKKLQEPEIQPPQPINKTGGLFSQHNPLVSLHVDKNIFFNKTGTEDKKTNEQNVQKPALNAFNTLSNNLFSNQNPQIEKPKQSIKLNLFTQNQTPASDHITNTTVPTTKQNEQSNINETISEKPSIFSDSKTSAVNIFTSKPSDTGLFGNIIPTQNTTDNKNSGLFQQVKITTAPAPSLFTTPTSTTNTVTQPKPKPQYQSGSLFSNNMKPLVQQVKPAQSTQNQANKSIFGGQVSSDGLWSAKKPEEQPNKSSLFSNNFSPPPVSNFNIFTNKPATTQPTSTGLFSHTAPGSTLFSSQTKDPIPNLAGNMFARPPIYQQSQNSNSNSAAVTVKIDDKQGEQSQKSVTKKKPAELFNDFVKSKPGDMFSNKDKPTTTNIFSNPSQSSNIFSNPAPAAGGSIFGNLSSNNNIFGNSTGNSLFPMNNNNNNSKTEVDDGSDQEGQQENQDGLIQVKEEIDPSKSSGNYKYQQSIVKFKETISKFKRGNQNIIENVTISIEKFPESANHIVCVRFPNKCHYFTGTILAGTTQIAKIKQDEYRNLVVKKILWVNEQGKNNLELLKIQFKDGAQGLAFFNKFDKIIKKQEK